MTGCHHHNDCTTCPFADCISDDAEPVRAHVATPGPSLWPDGSIGELAWRLGVTTRYAYHLRRVVRAGMEGGA